MPVREIKDEFQEFSKNSGRRDCKVLASSALNGLVGGVKVVHYTTFTTANALDLRFSDGVSEGIEWMVQCVKRSVHERPPTQKDIT